MKHLGIPKNNRAMDQIENNFMILARSKVKVEVHHPANHGVLLLDFLLLHST